MQIVLDCTFTEVMTDAFLETVGGREQDVNEGLNTELNSRHIRCIDFLC